MDKTDEQLAELCRKGDEIAFQELMRRYVKPIFGFVRQYTKTEEDAEDVSQDAFFKAWKYIKQYKKGKAFKPWLYAIARNTALDFLKKRKAIVFSKLDDAEEETFFADTLVDTEPLAAEVFDQIKSAEELKSALDILHPDHRSVLIMHYNEEMTFDEIADSIGKPMNTVKS